MHQIILFDIGLSMLWTLFWTGGLGIGLVLFTEEKYVATLGRWIGGLLLAAVLIEGWLWGILHFRLWAAFLSLVILVLDAGISYYLLAATWGADRKLGVGAIRELPYLKPLTWLLAPYLLCCLLALASQPAVYLASRLTFLVMITCMVPGWTKIAAVAGRDIQFRRHQEELGKQLIDATRQADKAAILRLLAEGAPIDYSSYGQLPLAIAAADGNADIVRLLLERGAKPEFWNYSPHEWGYFTAHALAGPSPEVTQAFLEYGADVNSTDCFHESAVFVAANWGNTATLLFLLDRGAKVAEEGRTLLMAASSGGHLDTVQALVQRGIALNAQDDKGWTALMYAAKHGSSEVVECLVKYGADTEVTSHDGLTALMYAAENTTLYSDNATYRDVIRILRAAQGQESLQSTILRGDISALQHLLARGDDPEAVDAYGQTAMQLALQRDQADMVGILLDHGVALESQDAAQRTLLIQAVRSLSIRSVRLLLERGANLNAKDGAGMTAFHHAGDFGSEGNFCWYWSHQQLESHLSIVEALLDYGADINAVDTIGSPVFVHFPMLLNAIGTPYYELAVLLITRGADVNIKDPEGRTALTYLLEDNDLPPGGVEILELLVKAGATQ